MTSCTAISFKDYLRLQVSRAKNAPVVDEYDDFILKIWDLFSLRAAAEDYFIKHRYVAKSRHGALPLPWEEIRRTLENGGPPENTLTAIAKYHFRTLEALSGNLRKVLMRVREMIRIEHVQQLDSHCLRWLTRQPGYSAVEKAGVRQEILGVVRKENYDTLENRVLVDFLRRCQSQSSMYLRKHGVKWSSHTTVQNVAKLKNLCVSILSMPECQKIKGLHEFPMPNYVLQQDRLYSRVWVEYCKIVRQDDVAERLWERRDEVSIAFDRLHNDVEKQCSPNAIYATSIWFNELDGKNDIFEAPIWECPLGDEPVLEPSYTQEETVIVDLAYPWDGRDLMVIPEKHLNAKPFIQNPHRPSLEPGRKVRLEEILKDRDVETLAAYFHHLHGLLGGKKWVVLVPDHWDASWLESVIRARPPELASRSDMFLLWRSVAAAIGYQTEQRQLSSGESLLIEDGYCHDKFNAISIRFMDDGKGGAIPQRASLRLHGENAENGDVRFLIERDRSDRGGLAKLNRPKTYGWRVGHLCGGDDLLVVGARDCLQKILKDHVPYFDEIDALSLVVTTRAEEVVFSKPIVQHIECWPGGKKFTTDEMQPVGILHAGSKKLALYLAEGEPRDDLKLKEWTVDFDVATKDDTEIMCQAEITPGQGLAVAYFFAPFLDRPKLVDIGSAKPSDMTRIRIERELKRHFPPVMPWVESCYTLWEKGTPKRVRGVLRTTSDYVKHYLASGEMPDAGAFALAQPYWGDVGENKFRRFGEVRNFNDAENSPIDKFKRENVFGNDKNHRYPVKDPKLWQGLFTQLMEDYRRGRRVLRLIAWTYQFDSGYFEEIREGLYHRYVIDGGKLKPEEITFCSNNFSATDKRAEAILSEVLGRISNHKYDVDELRLAYNLMQFNKDLLCNIPSSLCLSALTVLFLDFDEDLFFESTLFGRKLKLSRLQCAALASGYLRCMLFVLHKRRYDPGFFTHECEWRPKGLLAKSLMFISANQENTRKSLIEYVNGRGTLEGIPSN